MNIGDLVKINTFDDGNKNLIYESNVWKIIGFKFNKGKSIITNVKNDYIKPLSISSWKLNKIETQEINQGSNNQNSINRSSDKQKYTSIVWNQTPD